MKKGSSNPLNPLTNPLTSSLFYFHLIIYIYTINSKEYRYITILINTSERVERVERVKTGSPEKQIYNRGKSANHHNIPILDKRGLNPLNLHNPLNSLRHQKKVEKIEKTRKTTKSDEKR
jgi:hypothetical protein